MPYSNRSHAPGTARAVADLGRAIRGLGSARVVVEVARAQPRVVLQGALLRVEGRQEDVPLASEREAGGRSRRPPWVAALGAGEGLGLVDVPLGLVGQGQQRPLQAVVVLAVFLLHPSEARQAEPLQLFVCVNLKQGV